MYLNSFLRNNEVYAGMLLQFVDVVYIFKILRGARFG